MIDENMIKGLYCIASQDVEGDCYADHENYKHMDDKNWKRMVCGEHPRDYVSGKEAQCCPYHQTEYGVCFEDGELWWLKELADKLKEGGANEKQ